MQSGTLRLKQITKGSTHLWTELVGGRVGEEDLGRRVHHQGFLARHSLLDALLYRLQYRIRNSAFK